MSKKKVVVAFSGGLDTSYTVMKLTEELNNAKTDCVNASAQYNSMIRESQMTAYIDSMHIDLTSPDQPPFYLTDK